MAGLRAAQRELTRRMLLDSGLDLFEAKGYAFTTVDDIASGAGTTRTTFYVHFPSKADLMKTLIADVNELLVQPDDPPLSAVIESGSRPQIQTWIERKVDQWPDIRRCVVAANAAAASDPEIAVAISQWFEGAIDDIHTGLDAADRFDAASRHARAVLAFGHLELLSRRWFDAGWTELLPQGVSIDLLVDSWCWLLTEQPQPPQARPK